MERSAKYAYRVYEEKSFSAAAKSLFISQPSLSATVAHLEQELGFKIFDRSTSPLTLTAEGKIYIEALEEIRESEERMHRRINQLSNLSWGSLAVGGSSFIAYHLFPKICGEFYRRYPNIQVHVDMGNVGSASNLYDKLEQQSLELLLTYDYDAKQHDAVPVWD